MFILTFFLGFTASFSSLARKTPAGFDTPFALQRSLILASWLVAATGAVLLAGARPSDRAWALLVAGAEFFVVGALIAAVAEVSLLTREFTVTSVIGVVFASSLFVGEALIGAGLLRSGLVSTWVAWTVMVWNVLWLVTLLVISREDMYYPGLHYIPLLLIGIPLVDRRRRELLRQIPEDR